MIPNLNSMKCAKQVTIAIIEKNGNYWMGTNWCRTPQKKCPRENLPSGVGYDKCKDICNQTGHAEENAIIAAGKHARDSTLYLIGHTRICDNCRKLMEEAGVEKSVLVGDYWTPKKRSE